MRLLTGEVMVSPSVFSGIAFVFSLLLLLLLLHLYIIFCFLKPASPSRHQVNSGEEEGGADAANCVVCLSSLKEDGADAANCVVCLSSLKEDGDAVKVLPRCKHVFHTSCIGRWLSSYSVRCPLCRTPARAESPPVNSLAHLPLLFYEEIA